MSDIVEKTEIEEIVKDADENDKFDEEARSKVEKYLISFAEKFSGGGEG